MDRDIKFGVRGRDVGARHSWEDLNIEVTKVSTGTIEIVPRFHVKNPMEWVGDMFFLPPVEPGTKREFTLTGCWPGTWNPLRKEGIDRGNLVLTKETKLLRIRIVLPQGVNEAELRVLSPSPLEYAKPPCGKIWKEVDKGGRLSLYWEIYDADRRTYSYEIRCAELPRLLQQENRHGNS